MKIKVTKRDVSGGDQDNTASCPVALACRRAGLHSPSVSNSRIYFGKDNERVYLEFPLKVVKFIEDYDSGKKVKPLEFNLSMKKAVLIETIKYI